MTDEEFKKMFTINKNIYDKPKEETPIPTKEHVKRVLENKQEYNTKKSEGVPTLIVIYLLLVSLTLLGYFATQGPISNNPILYQILTIFAPK